MSERERILVTPRSLTLDVEADEASCLPALHEAGFEVLVCTPGEQPDKEALLAKLPGCVGYLAGVEPIDREVLERAAEAGLKVIARNGAGANNIDLEAAEALGIEVLLARGANACGVAELVFGLLLSICRKIPEADREMKSGEWTRNKGFELSGKTLGVVGYGNVGRRVVDIALGFGMRVLVHDPTLIEMREGIECVSMEALLMSSDVVTLHCPHVVGSDPVIDDAALAMMEPGVVLINTARFELMDEEAVLAALEHGHLRGLGLDVHAEEPPEDRRLASHPKVVATPHAGAFTAESVSRAGEAAVGNLLRALRAR